MSSVCINPAFYAQTANPIGMLVGTWTSPNTKKTVFDRVHIPGIHRKWGSFSTQLPKLDYDFAVFDVLFTTSPL